jgi:hypothetical protein
VTSITIKPSGSKKVHYLITGAMNVRVACNIPPHYIQKTSKAEEVTCLQCLRVMKQYGWKA